MCAHCATVYTLSRTRRTTPCHATRRASFHALRTLVQSVFWPALDVWKHRQFVCAPRRLRRLSPRRAAPPASRQHDPRAFLAAPQPPRRPAVWQRIGTAAESTAVGHCLHRSQTSTDGPPPLFAFLLHSPSAPPPCRTTCQSLPSLSLRRRISRRGALPWSLCHIGVDCFEQAMKGKVARATRQRRPTASRASTASITATHFLGAPVTTSRRSSSASTPICINCPCSPPLASSTGYYSSTTTHTASGSTSSGRSPRRSMRSRSLKPWSKSSLTCPSVLAQRQGR
jgi:hypothetical protein